MSHPSVLLSGIKGHVVQVSLPAHDGARFARSVVPGKRLRVLASADHSPKTREAAHPVYQFRAFAGPTGAALEVLEEDQGHTTIKGTVDCLHYARHGQPNGVILDSGEFIHLGPHGMAQTGLEVGAAVHATGEVRMTALGTRLLDAHKVNRTLLT